MNIKTHIDTFGIKPKDLAACGLSTPTILKYLRKPSYLKKEVAFLELLYIKVNNSRTKAGIETISFMNFLNSL